MCCDTTKTYKDAWVSQHNLYELIMEDFFLDVANECDLHLVNSAETAAEMGTLILAAERPVW